MMQFAEKVRNVTTRSVFHLNKSLFCVAAQILCQSTSAEEKKPLRQLLPAGIFHYKKNSWTQTPIMNLLLKSSQFSSCDNYDMKWHFFFTLTDKYDYFLNDLGFHFESKSQTFVKSTLTPTSYLFWLIVYLGLAWWGRFLSSKETGNRCVHRRCALPFLRSPQRSSSLQQKDSAHSVSEAQASEKKDRKQKDETQQKFKSIHFISNGPKQKMLLRRVAQNALFSSYSKWLLATTQNKLYLVSFHICLIHFSQPLIFTPLVL